MIIRRRYIRRESKTKAKVNRLYRVAVEAWKVGKRCAYPNCGKRHIDCHHSRGRVGSLQMDQRFWIPLCRRHHDFVADHTAKARELGLICELGKWNTPETL